MTVAGISKRKLCKLKKMEYNFFFTLIVDTYQCPDSLSPLPISTQSISSLSSGHHHLVDPVVSVLVQYMYVLCSLAILYTFFHPVPSSPHASDNYQSAPYIHTSVSILFIILFYFIIQILHVTEIVCYLSFSEWLISPSKIIFRSIHAFPKDNISFFSMAT